MGYLMSCINCCLGCFKRNYCAGYSEHYKECKKDRLSCNHYLYTRGEAKSFGDEKYDINKRRLNNERQ